MSMFLRQMHKRSYSLYEMRTIQKNVQAHYSASRAGPVSYSARARTVAYKFARLPVVHGLQSLPAAQHLEAHCERTNQPVPDIVQATLASAAGGARASPHGPQRAAHVAFCGRLVPGFSAWQARLARLPAQVPGTTWRDALPLPPLQLPLDDPGVVQLHGKDLRDRFIQPVADSSARMLNLTQPISRMRAALRKHMEDTGAPVPSVEDGERALSVFTSHAVPWSMLADTALETRDYMLRRTAPAAKSACELQLLMTSMVHQALHVIHATGGAIAGKTDPVASVSLSVRLAVVAQPLGALAASVCRSVRVAPHDGMLLTPRGLFVQHLFSLLLQLADACGPCPAPAVPSAYYCKRAPTHGEGAASATQPVPTDGAARQDSGDDDCDTPAAASQCSSASTASDGSGLPAPGSERHGDVGAAQGKRAGSWAAAVKVARDKPAISPPNAPDAPSVATTPFPAEPAGFKPSPSTTLQAKTPWAAIAAAPPVQPPMPPISVPASRANPRAPSPCTPRTPAAAAAQQERSSLGAAAALFGACATWGLVPPQVAVYAAERIAHVSSESATALLTAAMAELRPVRRFGASPGAMARAADVLVQVSSPAATCAHPAPHD